LNSKVDKIIEQQDEKLGTDKETFMTRWDTHDHENNKVFSYPRREDEKENREEARRDRFGKLPF
jgi:hypothetical protein